MKRIYLTTLISLFICLPNCFAQSAKVVVFEGDAYNYEGTNGDNYEVSWLDGYEHDPIPVGKARLETFSAEKGQGWCYLRTRVNERKRPSVKAPVLYTTSARLEDPANHAYPCFGKTNNWYKIKLPNGRFGYVRQDLVTWQASGFTGPRRKPYNLSSVSY